MNGTREGSIDSLEHCIGDFGIDDENTRLNDTERVEKTGFLQSDVDECCDHSDFPETEPKENIFWSISHEESDDIAGFEVDGETPMRHLIHKEICLLECVFGLWRLEEGFLGPLIRTLLHEVTEENVASGVVFCDELRFEKRKLFKVEG